MRRWMGLIRWVFFVFALPFVHSFPLLKVPKLISQHRRWLKGSFFAAVHSTVHFHYIYSSSQTFLRKAWVHVEMLFRFKSGFQLVCAGESSSIPFFTSLHLTLLRKKANYFIAFVVLVDTQDNTFNFTGIRPSSISWGLLITCFILSLWNRGYMMAIIGFAVIIVYMTVRVSLTLFDARWGKLMSKPDCGVFVGVQGD